jgi:hypothetical protein
MLRVALLLVESAQPLLPFGSKRESSRACT